MKIKKNILCFFSLPIAISFLICGCHKDTFLDKKPSSGIVVPSTLDDMTKLLDNTDVINFNSPGLPNLSGDDVYIPSLDAYNALQTSTEKNALVWAKDIYSGDLQIGDWNAPYQAIFYANVVLDQFSKLTTAEQQTTAGKNIKGWALFVRSKAYYELVQNFGPVYDATTAPNDLGVPLRLSPNVDVTQPRSTVEECYNQIFADLLEARGLVSSFFRPQYPNRPSVPAVDALLARIYLNRREYSKAELSADNCLTSFNNLLDYNTIDTTQYYPFGELGNNPEVIYSSSQEFQTDYSSLDEGFYGVAFINPDLVGLYGNGDLRKPVLYTFSNSVYIKNSGYGIYSHPFSGLATDEVILIKAECLARQNKVQDSMDALNTLLIKRYKTGRFTPAMASGQQEALNIILLERRKELVFRSLRWFDILRLNKEGANITLLRTINGQTYSLPPNDPRDVFPIPTDEIQQSGITQNQR